MTFDQGRPIAVQYPEDIDEETEIRLRLSQADPLEVLRRTLISMCEQSGDVVAVGRRTLVLAYLLRVTEERTQAELALKLDCSEARVSQLVNLLRVEYCLGGSRYDSQNAED